MHITCTQKKQHKNSKLTEKNRKEIRDEYCKNKRVTYLAEKYNVSRPTIYTVLKRARKREFQARNSTNDRYRGLQYGIKRLAKIEAKIIKKKNAEARRYNKKYPGEMFHVDTKRLPYIKGDEEKIREYLFVGIDDYSRELYTYIGRDKTQNTAAEALSQWLDECPYLIELVYSDNGTEYKGKQDHAYMELCAKNDIKKKYTKVKRPQTNGKAERVIRTLMDMWHRKNEFKSRDERRKSLKRFVNWYNCVKPHKGIEGKTPYEVIEEFYKGETSIA